MTKSNTEYKFSIIIGLFILKHLKPTIKDYILPKAPRLKFKIKKIS